MAAHPKRIEIAPEDRPVLEKWANAQAVERRLADRARIVLMAAEGRPADVIAGLVGRSAETVRRQRASYERHGLDGLRDRPKTGRPLTHGHEVRAKLIALACTRPPDTPEGVRRERWTHAELAAQVGMSQSQAHEILRNADVRLHLTQYWVMSELGPDFDAQAAEVCGLYLDPPADPSRMRPPWDARRTSSDASVVRSVRRRGGSRSHVHDGAVREVFCQKLS